MSVRGVMVRIHVPARQVASMGGLLKIGGFGTGGTTFVGLHERISRILGVAGLYASSTPRPSARMYSRWRSGSGAIASAG